MREITIIYLEKTSKQLSEENGQLVNDVYKLIKKYLALRNIVRNLLVSLLTVFFGSAATL